MRLLLADGNDDQLDLQAFALRREGFTVVAAVDGEAALEEWRRAEPDLILLELSLPRMGGLEVLRAIRSDADSAADTPVIIVAEGLEDDEVVACLDAGADDFISRPYSFRQLKARILAIMRRRGGVVREPSSQLRAAGLVLDIQEHEVWYDRPEAERRRLRPIEFRILRLLAENVGRVVTAQRLVEYAWDYEAGDPSMLKTHISHIRSKVRLRPQDSPPAELVALPTVGYVLRVFCPDG